jgi:transposase-like protein
MPKKILPSEQMEKALSDKLRQGLLDLSDMMVQTAGLWIQRSLEREREEFLNRKWAERTPEARGHANGYEPRTIATAEGAMGLKIPQVRNTKEPFRSTTLEVLKNRTDSLELLALQLYIGGLSYADIAEIFTTDLGVPNMSETVVMNLCASLEGAYREFDQRSLAEVKLAYLFIDGMYLRVSRNRKSKEAVLVARGYTEAGRPLLLGLSVGPRESYEAWKSFLSGLRARGLSDPILTTCDGCPGMLKAVAEVFPKSAIQRCLFHMRRTLLNAVPKHLELEIKDRLNEVFEATGYDAAVKLARKLLADYQGKAQSFVDKFRRHMDACLVYYKYPEQHWTKIRTSNTIERMFQEVKRRTKIIPTFGKESRCLMLCHAVIVELGRKKPWRGLPSGDSIQEHLNAIRLHLDRYEKRIEDFEYRIAA